MKVTGLHPNQTQHLGTDLSDFLLFCFVSLLTNRLGNTEAILEVVAKIKRSQNRNDIIGTSFWVVIWFLSSLCLLANRKRVRESHRTKKHRERRGALKPTYQHSVPQSHCWIHSKNKSEGFLFLSQRKCRYDSFFSKELS